MVAAPRAIGGLPVRCAIEARSDTREFQTITRTHGSTGLPRAPADPKTPKRNPNVSSTKLVFPEKFSLGVATSSYQIEGAVHEDGRGESSWDQFSRTPGKVLHGDTGDRACDHYHRFEEDLDLIAGLGVDVYRFSIAWPRIQPNGTGAANRTGLAFYRRLIDGLLARGVSPVPTLYHWDLPQAIQDAGGWTNRKIVEWFAEYARILVAEFGDSVSMWTTINEPWVATYLGYRVGLHAPGIAEEAATAAAHHHMLLAHGAAMAVIRESGTGAQVGIALNLMHHYPVSEHDEDRAAAALADSQLNRSFLDPLFAGRYPSDLGSLGGYWTVGGDLVKEGDLDTISAKMDFLSVNSYHPRYICAPNRLDQARLAGFVGGYNAAFSFGLNFIDVQPGDAAKTHFGWVIQPKGFEDLLLRLGRDYPGIPLFISENGTSAADYSDPDGRVHDPERIAYFDGHLRAALAAIEKGVDLRGYWAWSLLDNFEWAAGYSQRFGLVYIDYPTGTRTPKDSYHWFKRLIAARAMSELSTAATNGTN